MIHNVKCNNEQEVEEEKYGKRKQLKQNRFMGDSSRNNKFYNQLGYLKNDFPLNKEAKKYKMKKKILVETWSELLFLLIQWRIDYWNKSKLLCYGKKGKGM